MWKEYLAFFGGVALIVLALGLGMWLNRRADPCPCGGPCPCHEAGQKAE